MELPAGLLRAGVFGHETQLKSWTDRFATRPSTFPGRSPPDSYGGDLSGPILNRRGAKRRGPTEAGFFGHEMGRDLRATETRGLGSRNTPTCWAMTRRPTTPMRVGTGVLKTGPLLGKRAASIVVAPGISASLHAGLGIGQ